MHSGSAGEDHITWWYYLTGDDWRSLLPSRREPCMCLENITILPGSVIKDFIEDNEQVNQETLARWQEQGKVVSHQAVSQWLDTWGTDDEDETGNFPSLPLDALRL